ncbi:MULTISPECIES: PIN domain-containing protein [Bacillus cereus group]|uniref:PIN domain-containing protein n=1 Tax=Bacillus cereus group TaxID=86661 RepID=UPI00159BE7EF|nr:MULTISPECIES: PIN domain-containing protein [Bacillus cereus group]
MKSNLQGKHIVLDTNIIIRFPKILNTDSKALKLSIPSIVIVELKRLAAKGGEWKELSSVVDYALNNEMVIITEHNIKDDNDLIISLNNEKNKLDAPDLVILNLTRKLKEKGEDVVLATEDKALQQACSSLGIEYIGLRELKEGFNELSNKKSSPVFEKKIEELEKQSIKKVVLNILFLCVFAIIMFLFGRYYNDVINHVSIWGKILLLIAFAFITYWARCNLRLAYGLAEFSLGIHIAYPLFNFSSISSTYLSLLAALFIMIRGLDNITTGISETRYIAGTVVEKGWKFLFRLK